MVSKEDIVKLYIALLGRVPDGEGLDYWVTQASVNNWDMATLANNMYYAAVMQFPEYADVRKLVENIYKNVLGVSPEEDPEGINYWINEIISGKTTVGKVAADIIYVAQIQYPDSPGTKALQNRTEVGLYAAEKIRDPDINGDGVLDENDLEQFKQLIFMVDENPETIYAAEQTIDQFITQMGDSMLTCEDFSSKECDLL